MVNRFKRLIVLLFLAVAMVFGGCGVEPQPVAAHPSVGELSAEKATEIRQVYYEEKYVHDVGKIERVKILEYFGNFHGLELFQMWDYNLDHASISVPGDLVDANEENITNGYLMSVGVRLYLSPDDYPNEKEHIIDIRSADKQGYFTKEDVEELDRKDGGLIPFRNP